MPERVEGRSLSLQQIYLNLVSITIIAEVWKANQHWILILLR